MFKKIIALLIMVSFFYFVGATGVLASNNISVQVKTYLNNGQKNVPGVAQTGKSRGDKVSFSHPGGEYDFAFFAINGSIREDLPSTHEFTVQSRMEITAIYHRNGSSSTLEHAVVFVDSNRQIIDVKYVTDGSTVTEPERSELPTPPPFMEWAGTKWLTKGDSSTSSLGNITSSRVYHLQYTPVAELTTYALNVSLGLGSGNYAYNSVVTVTPTPQPGKAFSHWADAEGNKLSYKSSYKVSMLAATSIQAVFVDGATSPAEQPVVSMSDDLGIKGSQFVTYKGQMQLPAGYSIVEYGFIFSRSSEVLTLSSLGATIVPSNIHYGVTGEFMRSFPVETFNSIRAYMIVQNGSNPEEVVYSENYSRYPGSVGEELNSTYKPNAQNTGYGSKNVAYFDQNGENIKTFNLNGTQITSSSGKGVSDNMFVMNPAHANALPADQASIQFSAPGAKSIGFIIAPWATSETEKYSLLELQVFQDEEWITITDLLPLVPSTVGQIYEFSTTVSGELFRIYGESTQSADSRLIIDSITIASDPYSGIIHEVRFDVDGVKSSEFVADGATFVKSNPQKTGYSFVGWYTNENTPVLVNNLNPVIKSLSLVATWSINQYTITFDTDGGTSISSITQDYNTSVVQPDDPSKVGYTFNGWFSNSSRTTPYVFDLFTKNETVYAKFTPNQYTITYETGVEGIDVPSTNAPYGSSVNAPTQPERLGYSFGGWYYDEAANTSPVSFPFSMPLGGDVLYAKWVENSSSTFTVTFASVQGAPTPAAQVVNGGDLINEIDTDSINYVLFEDSDKLIEFNMETTISSNRTLYPVAYAQDLFISEYIEGGSNNKAIEIYNGTGKSINLSGYMLVQYNNTSTSYGAYTLNLSGTIAHGDTYVVVHNSAIVDMKNKADLTTAVTMMGFNGDDEVALFKNNVMIDLIGRIGSTEGNFAINKTYTRKSTIIVGVKNNPASFSMSTEWNEFPQDTHSDLGIHSVDWGK